MHTLLNSSVLMSEKALSTGSGQGDSRRRPLRLAVRQHAPHVDRGRPADLLPQFFLKLGRGTSAPRVGLRHAIERTAIERIQCGLRARRGQRADHNDRERLLGKERLQGGQTVHVRHLHVEREDVRLKGLDLLQGLPAVNGRADDRHVRGILNRRAQQLAHHHRIVDHQDANLLADHGVLVAVMHSCSTTALGCAALKYSFLVLQRYVPL